MKEPIAFRDCWMPNIRAERLDESIIIGAMLLNNDLIPILDAMEINQTDFTDIRNVKLLEAIQYLHDEKTTVDLVTVSDHLKNGLHRFDELGGTQYLCNLIAAVPPDLDVISQLETIRAGTAT